MGFLYPRKLAQMLYPESWWMTKPRFNSFVRRRSLFNSVVSNCFRNLDYVKEWRNSISNALSDLIVLSLLSGHHPWSYLTPVFSPLLTCLNFDDYFIRYVDINSDLINSEGHINLNLMNEGWWCSLRSTPVPPSKVFVVVMVHFINSSFAYYQIRAMIDRQRKLYTCLRILVCIRI